MAGSVVFTFVGDGELLAFAGKEDHQVGDAAMVDVGIGAELHPAEMIRVDPKISFHVFVNFFLQIDAEGAVGADYFVGADAGVGGNIAAGIGDADVGGDVADIVGGTFDGGVGEFVEEGLTQGFGLGKG